ncbi:TetR/AcrR family transcriptional regulator [Leucobacter sp. NPDC015123]|uniref:TetR/AcrR family transcriptional regulator n=1 Tax=Leucobacter sp. NPDC015123 TaxID=3364129 RepID=UPI0036F46CCF
MTLTAPAPAGATVRRGPGRPRDSDMDPQIISAVLGLIDAEEDVTVSRVVERSGVSRAALYRRWPSLTTLIAAALDVGRTVPPELPLEGDLRETLFSSLLGSPASVDASGYSEARFRQRIRLVMADRALQRAYWESHVSRRRGPVERALRAGIERGILRQDLDVEAAFDAIAGAAYYQSIVRGEPLESPDARSRLAAAFEITWRGMVA